jgi:hypothetical protein
MQRAPEPQAKHDGPPGVPRTQILLCAYPATSRAQLLLCVDNYSAWWYAVKLSLELEAGDP